MGGRSLWTLNGKAFSLVLLLLAIFTRVVVPPGWMPAGDGLHIRPCTALSVPAMAHRATPDHHRDSIPSRAHGDFCAFTAFAMPLLTAPGPSIALAPVLSAFRLATGISENLVTGRGLAAPPPPQTGPPPAI